MASRQGGTLSGFTPLSTPNAPTDLSVSTSIGSATVSFTAPTDTGDGAVTSFIVTAIDESTGVSAGATGSASPITISPGGGTFKIRAQAVNGFGAGRLTEFSTGNAIFSGAELYAWGLNSDGRLGDSTTVNKSSPVQIGALTNWAQVSGNSFATSVKTDGTLWTWGQNGSGQLGDGTIVNKSSPVQVGALTTWTQVSGGSTHTVAITLGGELYASGNGHTASIKTDGTLWTWGYNNRGQLGDGTVVNKSSPIQVGALTDWLQVSAGGRQTAAITLGNELYAWGYNGVGQLGDGTVVYKSSPVQIGALTNWAQVSTVGGQTASIKTDGTIWTWGNNNNGQLGDNTVVAKSSPVQVGALTNWAQVSVGDAHTAAIKTDGTLWVWGGNSPNGQLGDGTTVNKSSPVQIGALTNWTQVAAGNVFSVAILGVI
jgi:alpha-tubulin suppressor-like RCC1 family protein